jgi:hypothetical protein
LGKVCGFPVHGVLWGYGRGRRVYRAYSGGRGVCPFRVPKFVGFVCVAGSARGDSARFKSDFVSFFQVFTHPVDRVNLLYVCYESEKWVGSLWWIFVYVGHSETWVFGGVVYVRYVREMGRNEFHP